MSVRLGTAFAALLVLAACAVGPDFKRPAAPEADRFVPGATLADSDAQRFIAGAPVPARWWTAFHSPAIDALVEEAFAANPSVAAAQAALRQARENYLAQRSSFFPNVGAGAGASRNRNPVSVLAPTLTSGAPLYNLYTADVSVSYTLDVFGGNRRATESQRALAEASRFQLDATYLTVAGNVVVAAVQQAGLGAEVAATERAIGFERDSLAILKKQFDLGGVDRLDVAAQETALAGLEATLPPLRRQLQATRHLLATLTGHLPADAAPEVVALDGLTLPAEVPLGLPADLVNRRPDVRAAEAELHAATADDGVAIANLLPAITLNGNIGSSATALDQLLKSGTGFWSAGANLTQTLFAGGQLLHRKRSVDAALDQAAANYRATVLAAFQDVADSLRALESDAAVLEASTRAERSADEGLAIVRRRQELGGVNYLVLLGAEQAAEQTRIARLSAATARLADTATLFQALAGATERR